MMNLVLHGIRRARLKLGNVLSEMSGLTEDDLNRRYRVILSNPPFAGQIPRESIRQDLPSKADADAKAERILPALFIKMFGDPATNPMGWPVVQLGDVAQEFISGGTPSTRVEHYWTGDIPWITGADVTDNVVVAGRKWITQEAIDNSATHVVPKGAILLVTRTGVGKVAIAGADIAISQDLTGIVLKEGTNADFVAAAIRQKTRNLLDIQQGAIIKGVLRKDVEKLKIPLPALSTQQKFADSVADIVKLEANRSESHRRLETLFQSSLYRAFSGDGRNCFKRWSSRRRC